MRAARNLFVQRDRVMLHGGVSDACGSTMTIIVTLRTNTFVGINNTIELSRQASKQCVCPARVVTGGSDNHALGGSQS